MPYDVLPYKKLVKVERTLDFEGTLYNLITWEDTIPNITDITGWNVYSSRTPSGPWELLNSTPLTVNFYRHRFTLQKGFLYYKVTYISTSLGEEKLDDVPPIAESDEDIDGFQKRLKWITLEQLRRLNLLLSWKGEPCYLLVRRRFGERCPKCFDQWGASSTSESCDVCYGTGFEGGYDVFEGRFHVADGSERLAETEAGWNVTYNPRVWITDYPVVKEGDILVRKGDFQRYWIQDVRRQVQQSKLLMQTFSIAVVEEDNPVYKFSL